MLSLILLRPKEPHATYAPFEVNKTNWMLGTQVLENSLIIKLSQTCRNDWQNFLCLAIDNYGDIKLNCQIFQAKKIRSENAITKP